MTILKTGTCAGRHVGEAGGGGGGGVGDEGQLVMQSMLKLDCGRST